MLSFCPRKSLNKRKTQKGGASLARGIRALGRRLGPIPKESKMPVFPATGPTTHTFIDPLIPIGFEPLPKQLLISKPSAGIQAPSTISNPFVQQRRTAINTIKRRINAIRSRRNAIRSRRNAVTRNVITTRKNAIKKRRNAIKSRRNDAKAHVSTKWQRKLTKKQERINKLLKLRNEAEKEISDNIKNVNTSLPPNKILSRILGTSRSSLRSLKQQLITIKFVNKILGSHEVNMKKILEFLKDGTNNLEIVTTRKKFRDIVFPIKKFFRERNNLLGEPNTISTALSKISKKSMKKKYPDEILEKKRIRLEKLRSSLSDEAFKATKLEIEHIIEEHEIKRILFKNQPNAADYEALKAILNDVDNMIPVIKRTNVLKTELVSIIRCCFSRPDFIKTIKEIMFSASTPGLRFNQQQILNVRTYLKEILVIRKQMVEKIKVAKETAVDKEMFDNLITEVEKVNLGFELFVKYGRRAMFIRGVGWRARLFGGAQTQSPENVQAIFDESVTMLNYFIEDFAIETGEDLIETKELESNAQPAIIYDATYEDFNDYNDKFIALKELIKEEIITFLATDIDRKPKALVTYGNRTTPIKSPLNFIREMIKMTPEQRASAEAIERSVLERKKVQEQEQQEQQEQ